jgi:hypothetical protein
MADTEDWRRRRAEELRLHDPAPLPVRPARDRAADDGIEALRPPLEPVRPLVAPTNPPPVRDEISHGDSGTGHGAKPAARRYRQESPIADTTGAVSFADAPLATRRPVASRAPKMSMVARHPLVFGVAIGGALTAAGMLGWLLRVETEPVPVLATAMVQSAPRVSVAAPAIQPDVTLATPGPLTTSAGESERRAGDAPAAPANGMPPLAPKLVPALKAPLPHDAAASAAPPVSSPTSAGQAAKTSLATTKFAAEAKLAATAKATAKPELAVIIEPAFKTKPTTTPIARNDKTSRFAHPAKAVVLPGRGFGPSFNCRRAIAAVNRAICANPTLSALDRQLSQTFYRATAHVDLERNKAIDRDQVDFLNQRAGCNSDECVARVYRQRLAALRQTSRGE